MSETTTAVGAAANDAQDDDNDAPDEERVV